MLLGAHIHNFGILHDMVIGVSFDELISLTTDQAADLFDPALSPVPENRLPLGQLNTLIGRNSTGKSALFSALSFLSDCLRHDIAFACEQNGRHSFTSLKTTGDRSNICFSLTFSGETNDEFLNYELCLSSDPHGRPFVAREFVRRAWSSEGSFSTESLLALEHGKGTVSVAGNAKRAGTLRDAGVTETKAPALAAYGLLLDYPLLNRIHGQISRWYFDHLSQPPAQALRAEPVRQGGHRHVSVTGDNVRNVLEFLEKENPAQYVQALNRIAERMPNEKRIDRSEFQTSANSQLCRSSEVKD